jgi:hypothetical protein
MAVAGHAGVDEQPHFGGTAAGGGQAKAAGLDRPGHGSPAPQPEARQAGAEPGDAHPAFTPGRHGPLAAVAPGRSSKV